MQNPVSGTMLATVALWMVVATCATAGQTTDEFVPRVEVDRPTGEYQLTYLKLTTEAEAEGPAWMVLALRDGKGAAAWLPTFAPSVDADAVRLADGRLTGQIMDRSPTHTPGIRFVYTLDAKIDDGRVTGTWHRSANAPKVRVRDPGGSMLPPASGTLSGVVRSADTLRERQAYAAGADWPMWMGSTGDRNAVKTNVALIDSLFDARPVWKCEPLTAGSPGRANDIPRHGVKSLYNRASGGGATPIMADGRVLLKKISTAVTAARRSWKNTSS